MTEKLGTARIEVEVDISSLQAAAHKAKTSLTDMTSEAKAQYDSLNAKEKRRVESLTHQINKLGMTKAEQLAYVASLKLEGAALDDAMKRLAQRTREIERNTAALNENGISAKHAAWNARQLPMQMTDIVVGLSTGQKPLTVLLQQGGQLKDMFGGVGAAAKAMGGYIAGIVNPATVATAAVGSLAVAWWQGYKEMQQFENAVISSGNAAGVTAGRLAEIGDKVGALTGQFKDADSAAIAFAKSGLLAADEIEGATKAAVQFSQLTGASISEATNELIRLASKGSDGAVELNNKYHFLTVGVFKHIQALEEQGNKQEAVKVIVDEFAKVHEDRMAEAQKSVGALESLWKSLGITVGSVWNEMKNVGRSDLEYRIAQKENELKVLRGRAYSRINDFDRNYAEEARVERELEALRKEKLAQDEAARSKAAQQALHDEAIRRDQENAKLREQFIKDGDRYLTDAQRKTRELADVQEKLTRGVITEAQARERSAQIEADYARRASRSRNRGGGDKQSEYSKLASQIERQLALNAAELNADERLTASGRLIVQMREAMRLAGSKLAESERQLLEAKLSELRASDEALVKAQKEKKAAEELARLKKAAAEAIARQNLELSQQAENRREANEIALASLSMGSAEIEMMNRRLEIQREYAQALKSLGDRSVSQDQATWDRLAENARRHRDEQLLAEEQFQMARARLVADWRVGAQAAWAEYQEHAGNVAQHSRDAFSNVFKGMEDALAKFVQTGKLSFSDLARSIIADIARIGARAATMQIFQAIISGMGRGGVGSTQLGNNYGNFGTGGSSGFFGTLGTYANGGAFQGVSSLSAMSGQVVSRPTIFPFANGGAFGLMGEAGAEAIMPLKRTQGGKLGVIAAGMGRVEVVVNNNGNEKASVREETMKGMDGMDLRRIIVDVGAEDIGSGGKMALAMRHRFGLREAM